MKVGLFFGSFNPIHIGHLIIGNVMAEHADLDEVWYVVTPQNPLKKNNTLLHEFDRYDMVNLAIMDHPKFRVSDVEFHLPKPSYTIDTLTYIQEKFPQNKFVLIIGEDNLCQLPKWKNYNSILEYFELYVYPRPNSGDCDLKNHKNVRFVEAPLLDISATYIRQSIKKNLSVKYMITQEVEIFIKNKNLYR